MNSVRWKEKILQLGVSPPIPKRSIQRPPSTPLPPKANVGTWAPPPPLRVEKILHLNIGLGGKGGKREWVQCLCCIMDGFVSVSSDGAIFIPPTDWGRGFAIILRSAPRGISLGSASRDDSRKVELRQTGQPQLGNPS